MSNLQDIKHKFHIVGNSLSLDRALSTAVRVASTDLTVLISGESGVGKEVFSKIIHYNSSRKHGNFIAVNCGAIPEGTIDSELFGHEKGAFTGATESRKGWFEAADNGTIFLDEVGELPLQTQVRLLRVLETGEFIKVGSSKVVKTNVRVIAATNVNLPEAVWKAKFREDLYYRLNTVPITVPNLRDRGEDIVLLFRKFAVDFANKYQMPVIRLDTNAQQIAMQYQWQGNVRQLKNVTEQLSILETDRSITAEILVKYLPSTHHLPAIYQANANNEIASTDKDQLYDLIYQLRKEVTDLKQIVAGFMTTTLNNSSMNSISPMAAIATSSSPSIYESWQQQSASVSPILNLPEKTESLLHTEDSNLSNAVENLSLYKQEKESIIKALQKYKSRRKLAATELGISERTLYRKIKDYDIDL